MAVQVRDHLMLGLGNKAQAPAIAGLAGQRADGESTGIEQRG